MNIPLLSSGARKEAEMLDPKDLKRQTLENRLWTQRLMGRVIRSGTRSDYETYYAPGQPDRMLPKEGTLFKK